MAAVAPLLPEYAKNRWVLRGRLLHYEGGALPGVYPWFRLACTRPFTLTVANVTTGSLGTMAPVRILVSDRYDTPPTQVLQARIAAFAPLGTDIVIPQSFIYDAPFEWITAVTTAMGDPVAVDLAAG
jgi:hypothetical protein